MAEFLIIIIISGGITDEQIDFEQRIVDGMRVCIAGR